MTKPDRPTVRVRPNRFQPTNAELERPFTVRRADGSMPTPEEQARTALRPVNVVEDLEA